MLTKSLRCLIPAIVLCWAIISAAQEASPPRLILLDPVPALLSGPAVTTDVNVLATKGRAVQGTGADGASEVVLRIPAASVGEQFTITLFNDQGQQSQSYTEDGGLGAIGTSTFTASQITVTAVTTTAGPRAFAIYGSPVDFPRPEGQDENSSQRFVSLHVTASGQTSENSVTLLRPPLVLIHGLWGSPQS